MKLLATLSTITYMMIHASSSSALNDASGNIAIRVLFNKGDDTLDKINFHCSAPERAFIEQVVNIGVQDPPPPQGRRHLKGGSGHNVGARKLVDCRYLCKNIAPGYCVYRSRKCRGWRRRSLMISDNIPPSLDNGGDDASGGLGIFGGDNGGQIPSDGGLGGIPDPSGGLGIFGGDNGGQIPSDGGLGGMPDLSLLGLADGGDGTGIPSGSGSSGFGPSFGGSGGGGGLLDDIDFSNEMADLDVPNELLTTLGGNCETETEMTKKLTFQLLEQDLSIACMNLLTKEVKFQCVQL